MKIGVLALQGAFREHIVMFKRCGALATEIRLPEELKDMDGLAIPGGESSAILRLMDLYGLRDALLSYAASGKPILGTCAGAILLSRSQNYLNLIDVRTVRNAYGRQIDSREAVIELSFSPDEPFRAVFIRAPVIDEAGKDVHVMASYRDKPVLARQNNILVATFHPELTGDERIHSYFLDMIS
ncbi:MAG: pyridoxal 5'-phosphate synthase glutaminase subunit PdxT [Syntrophales bacterium]|nr:pyridoxal 5'-phosphate synthase glutaminase subunit PdxT [Syntrophales bacterium]